jgi:hypothetical protein
MPELAVVVREHCSRLTASSQMVAAKIKGERFNPFAFAIWIGGSVLPFAQRLVFARYHAVGIELPRHPLQFHKRSQLFIGPHDETFFLAMRVNNPDCSSPAIQG